MQNINKVTDSETQIKNMAKYALVTGGSRGIGKQIAKKLSDMGYDLIVNYLNNTEAAEETKRMIEANGGKNVGSVSKKTSFILAGENMGPEKRKKAENLGVEIISETQFLNMINHE